MKEIIIRLDYLQGPILKKEYNIQLQQLETGVDVVDNDIVLQTLNSKAEEIYSSLYEFDKLGQPCVFNERRFETETPKLLSLVSVIIQRLNDINDGSFVVKDEETKRLMLNSTKVS